MWMTCSLVNYLSQTQKNVSEPQTGFEPATFWSPVRRSNHWATMTQMAERRPRCVPVRKRDTHTANTAVSICQCIVSTNIYIYIYEDDLQLGKLKENCLLLNLYRKLREMVTFFWVWDKAWVANRFFFVISF